MKKSVLVEILILFILFLGIFSISIFTWSKLFVEPNMYTIEFKDIDGITKGSPVRFMGINIGYVKKLKTKNRVIEVQILVTKKNMKIPNGTKARVEFYGLGGSKSIELMPPETNNEVGIITNKTLRISDVVNESKGIVAILELVEKIFDNVNKTALENSLKTVSSLKDEKMNKALNDFSQIKNEYSPKLNNVVEKQRNVTEKIDKANDIVENINKFIKK